MASGTGLILLAMAALLVPAILATEFIVGDGSGWTIGYDYQAWATGKNFYVGDTLVFNYAVGVHNVNKVNQTAFQDCTIPLSGALESGKDVITLATPGKKWYICGKGKHCEVGKQKLAITVMDAAPAPGPSSAPPAITGWAAAALAAVLLKHLVV
uniref:Phytocyanin domain-containing protein n=1 Tax=Kalanchoe fedtschenkoi TaxID=63787 RepID=A0A7N0U1K5_KALFE